MSSRPASCHVKFFQFKVCNEKTGNMTLICPPCNSDVSRSGYTVCSYDSTCGSLVSLQCQRMLEKERWHSEKASKAKKVLSLKMTALHPTFDRTRLQSLRINLLLARFWADLGRQTLW